jgi:hypothetical protein
MGGKTQTRGQTLSRLFPNFKSGFLPAASAKDPPNPLPDEQKAIRLTPLKVEGKVYDASPSDVEPFTARRKHLRTCIAVFF